MIGKTLPLAALCCSYLCYGSGPTRISTSAALLYPFSEIERELFRNTSLQEIESPYSTTSVESFSATKMVSIEKRAYEKLHQHAKNRSQHVATQFSKIYEILPRDCQKDPPRLKEIFIVALAAVAKRHNATLEKLMVTTDHAANPAEIVISERDLMHLLQWSRGITMVWEIRKERAKGFFIDIALDKDEILIAPKLLKQFIIRACHHDQWQKQRFFGSRA